MTIKEKIMKIMSLALEINPPEIEDIGKKRTAVFIDWAPHCCRLDVTIHYGGWKIGTHADEYLDVTVYRENASEQLDDIIKKLEEIKAEIDKGDASQ